MAHTDTVRIVLAHHLDRQGKSLLPGDEIEVPHDEARQLVSAGYVAGVDPSDAEAVAKALAPAVERKPALSKAPANKAAEGQASA
ncbi:hypothetical protein [Kitasatospora sp. NBC_01300]|uniref:hypothetical protein n=1 Tax=Kitasatospora sp. NBC_01300 TaxID=2903574 RepID=UPI00352D2C05|nr:hypothetical protein OG556_16305 [Kitasatospora sp. NBC_01300]